MSFIVFRFSKFKFTIIVLEEIDICHISKKIPKTELEFGILKLFTFLNFVNRKSKIVL